MSDLQARVLNFIRRQGGQIASKDLSIAYGWRALVPLEKAGFIRFIICGTCEACKCKCTCYNERIKAS